MSSKSSSISENSLGKGVFNLIYCNFDTISSYLWLFTVIAFNCYSKLPRSSSNKITSFCNSSYSRPWSSNLSTSSWFSSSNRCFSCAICFASSLSKLFYSFINLNCSEACYSLEMHLSCKLRKSVERSLSRCSRTCFCEDSWLRCCVVRASSGLCKNGLSSRFYRGGAASRFAMSARGLCWWASVVILKFQF